MNVLSVIEPATFVVLSSPVVQQLVPVWHILLLGGREGGREGVMFAARTHGIHCFYVRSEGGVGRCPLPDSLVVVGRSIRDAKPAAVPGKL